MSAGPAQPQEGDADDPWAHLTIENRQRLTTALRERVNEVFRANRVIEQRTGYTSAIARQMLVDVLSHLAVLAQDTSLTPIQQASQLAKIEEHLHRAMIEHPEEVIRNRIVDVEERWAEYERVAFPLREDKLLTGVPLHRELEEDRARIASLLESARSKKPQEVTWDETLTAAAEMTEAAHLTRELADKLEKCIGKAADVREQRSNRNRWRIGVAVAVALAICSSTASYFIGRANSDSDAPPTTTSTTSAPAATTP